MTPRLESLDDLPADVARPAYLPRAHGIGIVHLGVGAFHRAHQAPATDDALAADGGDWRIQGVSLTRPDAARRLNPQNGLYTLLVRAPEATTARVIGAIAHVLTAPDAPERVLERLADPAVRVVSLTVTEKAYGLDAATGGLDLKHPSVAADLAHPEAPTGPLGYLVEALARRRNARTAPFTPLCCDNLPHNGAVLGRLVLELAERRDPTLARWIEREVPFPSTMVDRITPASTETTFADAARLTGCRDEAAVETEPFSQWVIEDRFATMRPPWEAGGALLVEDVRAHERMKLRMLNGAHSLIAYLGVLANLTFVRDVMAVPVMAALVRRHMVEAAASLGAVPGIDLDHYAEALCARFANKAIAHKTAQIAMDGTQKLPQRLLEPAVEALDGGRPVDTFALAVAAWMAFVHVTAEVSDPRAGEIRAALDGVPGEPRALAGALERGVAGLFPRALQTSGVWRGALEGALGRLLAGDVRAACRPLVAGG